MLAAEEAAPTILTAGFSNLGVETFLANMHLHGAQVLLDVRSRPYASYTPHFNQDQIEASVNAAGLRYLFMGRELGGQPDNPGFYDEQGYVLYDRIAASPDFREGVERVMYGLSKGLRIVLCCAEENPRHCHRRLLVGRVLRQRGVAVAHVLGDGNIISETELLEEEARAPRQLSLFGGVEQPRAWRSMQPYPQRLAQGDSSPC